MTGETKAEIMEDIAAVVDGVEVTEYEYSERFSRDDLQQIAAWIADRQQEDPK